MWKFASERITKQSIQTNSFKQTIPVAIVNPIQINDQTCVFVFNSGLAGTINSSLLMDGPCFNNNYFITYEKQGHGDNKNKPSQFKKSYLIELDEVIDWVKKNYPSKKIYLLGESWGSAINFLYLKKYTNKIDGVINWNMPTKPIDPEKKTFKQMVSIAWREVLTFLFNITFYLPAVQKNYGTISRNKLLIRAMEFAPTTRSNTKLTLAVWRYMKPSLNFLKKNVNNPNYNFLYIQSAQDALADWKIMNNIANKSDLKHFKKMPTGYHVLSMEPDEHQEFCQLIQDFVK